MAHLSPCPTYWDKGGPDKGTTLTVVENGGENVEMSSLEYRVFASGKEPDLVFYIIPRHVASAFFDHAPIPLNPLPPFAGYIGEPSN
jgi:hypothetical protein